MSGEYQTDGLAHIAISLNGALAAGPGGPVKAGKAGQAGGPGGADCILSDARVVLPLAERQTRLINGFGCSFSTLKVKWPNPSSNH